MNRLPQLVFFFLIVLAHHPQARGGSLILSRSTSYFSLDLETGEETLLARGSLDSAFNQALQVNASIAYQNGEVGDEYAVSATDLESGATRTYILPGGFVNHLGGIHDGKLILVRGTSWFALDLETGREELLARGSLDTPVNHSFEVRSGIAYQGGRIGGQHAVSATDLETGATRDYIVPGGFFSHFEGFHDDKLVLVRSMSYFALDLETGQETFLARGSLDNAVNASLEVHSGVVYQGGRIGDQYAVSATTLATGATRDYIVPGGFFSNFEGAFDSRVRIEFENPSSALEDAGRTFQAVLTRFGCTDRPLTVNLTFGGSAAVGSDFSLQGATMTSAVMSAGQARAIISLETLVENIDEADETIVITLEPGESYSLVEDQSVATATIENDDFSAVAVPDPVYSVVEDGSLAIDSQLGVLVNDTDQDDGDGPAHLTAHLEDDVAHGTLILEPDGGFAYTPEPDYFGTDTFSYRASDQTNSSEPVFVEIEVTELVDLTLTASKDREIVAAAERVTHTVSVRNEGPSDATAIALDFTAKFPTGVTAAPPVISTGTLNGNLWRLDLPEGETATLQITYAVSTSAPGGIGLISTRSAVALNKQPLTNTADDSALISTGIINPGGMEISEAGAPALNLQSALITQQVSFTNSNELPLSGFRVGIGNLPAGVVVNNAHGTNVRGGAFVESDRDLRPGESITLTFEFFRTSRDAAFDPAYSIESVYTEDRPRPAASSAGAQLDRILVLENADTLLEFSSDSGITYAIEYSSDMESWRRVVPAVTARANRTQWIDSGPPKTSSHPSSAGCRYYRVVTLPDSAGRK